MFKHREDKQLSNRMQLLELKHSPQAVSVLDDVTEEESRGHLYWLDSVKFSEFPQLGFEVWIGGRDNGGDLAQSVVDTLYAIAKLYQQLAVEHSK